MYAPHAPDTYRRSDIGLGWIAQAATAAVAVGSHFFGPDGSIPAADYYPAVKRGTLLCPGPFNIPQATAGLDARPELMAEVDAVLRLDRAWTDPELWGPLSSLDNRTKASALVNWAHGGRNCEVTSGETGALSSRGVLQKLMVAAPPAPAPYTPASPGPAPTEPPTGVAYTPPLADAAAQIPEGVGFPLALAGAAALLYFVNQ